MDRDTLLEIRDLIDGYVDVVDGTNGPRPNKAMRAQQIIDELVATLAQQAGDGCSDHSFHQHIAAQLTIPVRCGTCGQVVASPTNTAAGSGGRPCTCHPDDNPPVPCPRKYALSECRKVAAERCQSAVPHIFVNDGEGFCAECGFTKVERPEYHSAPQDAAPPAETHPERLHPESGRDAGQAVAALTLPEEPQTRHYAPDWIRTKDYDALRAFAEQEHDARVKAEAQVAALTEAYAAACIRLQALGEKTVPLTQAAARSGKGEREVF